MIQAYSTNIDVAANSPYPLYNTVLDKGCGETPSGISAIQLNKRGIYLVEVDGYALPDAADVVSAQLYVNGVPQPQAISQFTGAAITSYGNFSFKTLVRVAQDNTPQCYTAPTLLQIMNGDTAVSDAHINICVTKLC